MKTVGFVGVKAVGFVGVKAVGFVGVKAVGFVGGWLTFGKKSSRPPLIRHRMAAFQ